LVAACLDGTLVDADDEASRDHAIVGVEETDHVVVAATSRVEVLHVLSGQGEPDNEDDSRESDAHHDKSRKQRPKIVVRRPNSVLVYRETITLSVRKSPKKSAKLPYTHWMNYNTRRALRWLGFALIGRGADR